MIPVDNSHSRTESRRKFLEMTGSASVLGTVGMAGCLGDDDGNGNGNGNGDAGELQIFQWGDYWPDGFVQDFEAETGIDVSVSNYASNEEMFNSLQAGGTDQYDLIFPSDYMVNILSDQDMIQPIDVDQLSNWSNLSSEFQDAPYDPTDDRYSAPYQWGATGIGYNTEMTGEINVSSWETMWDEAFAGQMTMLDDMRETIGAALKYLGYSLNTTDEDEVAEARDALIEQKELLLTYDSENMSSNLLNQQASPVHTWSSAAFQAYWETWDEDDGSPIDYVIPEEGSVVWVDCASIPAGAPNVENAHAFIDYFLDAEKGAELTNYTYYGSPNEAAEEHIYEEILENESIYPDEETMARLEHIENIGDATEMYDEAWTDIKSA